MHLCVLSSSYLHSSAPYAELDPTPDPSRYAPEWRFSHEPLHKATSIPRVRALAAQGFDAFVNLCDGAWDEDRAGIEVPQALERLGQAFTGAGSAFYEPSRDVMKRACHYAGISTPGFVFAEREDDAERIADTLRFPMIVKHPSSYNSVGMRRDARCETLAGLREVVARNVAAYGGALVEEFVEGREFTVLVAEPGAGESEPRAWVPVEFVFPAGETFKHFDLKWVDYRSMSTVPVADEGLARRLREDSQRFFAALGGTGYGRCDLRMDASGRLFMLEINPNCSIFYPPDAFGSADFILANSPGGHRGFLEHVVGSALRRQDAARPVVGVRHHPKRGYGLVALRDLAAGTVVQAGEERAHFLVSRGHVERAWDAQKRRWFREYAWPLTDDVHVMWSDRAEDWQPINHSCDPNSWLEGLALVTRRAVRAGEPVTVDYGTFCGPAMEPFPCDCQSPECRGTIRAEDHLSAAIGRYGDHVSDYVRRARAAAGVGAP
jgi:D-alanine-D-alanine ligase